MTEREWLESIDAQSMLEFLHVYPAYPAEEWLTNYGYPKPTLPALSLQTTLKRFVLFALYCAKRKPLVTAPSTQAAYDELERYTGTHSELHEFVAAYDQLRQGKTSTKVEIYPLTIWVSCLCEHPQLEPFRGYTGIIHAAMLGIAAFDAGQELSGPDGLTSRRSMIRT